MTEPDTGPGSPWASPAAADSAAPPAHVPHRLEHPADVPWPAAPPLGAAGPQGWGPPLGPRGAPRTSPLSIIALVTGLIGLFPVAIPVAVVALVRLRRGTERGRGLAIGGLVAASCWLVVVGLVVVGLLASAFSGTGGVVGPVARAGGTSVGSCLQTGDREDAQVPCDDPHDEEVFLRSTFAGGTFPGRDELSLEADDACYAEYGPYVGTSYEDSTLDYAYYVPSAAEWRAGERRLVCVVVPGDSPTLPGRIAGSGT